MITVLHRPTVLVDRLVPARVSRTLVGSLLLVLAGALLVAVAAQVRIPLGFTPVPLSGQTFAVLVVGASLGAARGGLSLGLYLLLGIAGMPVFAGGNAGIAYAFGATSGYLLGFVAAAVLLGYLAERRLDRRIRSALLGFTAASLLIYVFGAVGLMLATERDLPAAIRDGIVPFVIGDVLKVALAAVALPGAWRLVERVTGNRG